MTSDNPLPGAKPDPPGPFHSELEGHPRGMWVEGFGHVRVGKWAVDFSKLVTASETTSGKLAADAQPIYVPNSQVSDTESILLRMKNTGLPNFDIKKRST